MFNLDLEFQPLSLCAKYSPVPHNYCFLFLSQHFRFFLVSLLPDAIVPALILGLDSWVASFNFRFFLNQVKGTVKHHIAPKAAELRIIRTKDISIPKLRTRLLPF